MLWKTDTPNAHVPPLSLHPPTPFINPPFIKKLHYSQQLFDHLYNERDSMRKLTLVVLVRERLESRDLVQEASSASRGIHTDTSTLIEQALQTHSRDVTTTQQPRQHSISLHSLKLFFRDFDHFAPEFQILYMNLNDAPPHILELHHIEYMPHSHACLIFRDGRLLQQQDYRWYRCCVRDPADQSLRQVTYYLRSLLSPHSTFFTNTDSPFQKLMGTHYKLKTRMKRTWYLFICVGWCCKEVMQRFCLKLARLVAHCNATIDRACCSLLVVDITDEDISIKNPNAIEQLRNLLEDYSNEAAPHFSTETHLQITQLIKHAHRAHFLHQLGEESPHALETEPILYIMNQRPIKPSYVATAPNEELLSNTFARGLSFPTHNSLYSNPEQFMQRFNKWRDDLARHSYFRETIRWKHNLGHFDFRFRNVRTMHPEWSYERKHIKTLFPKTLVSLKDGKEYSSQKLLCGKRLIGVLNLFEGIGSVPLFMKKISQLMHGISAYNNELFELVVLPIVNEMPDWSQIDLRGYCVPHALTLQQYSLGHHFEQLWSAYICGALGIPVESCSLHILRLDHEDGFMFRAVDYHESWRLEHSRVVLFKWLDSMTLESDFVDGG